jgi:WD40 repeat protein/predicted Ser/Thr protein kinase
MSSTPTDAARGNGPAPAPQEARTLPPAATPHVPPAPGKTEAYPPRTKGGPEPERPGLPQVAGYEVLGELGRGGMGVVYQARQTSLGRLVALKTILAGDHAGDEERRRFCAEAEAVARLQHPNIVQVHEVGEANGHPFFSLEYCPGGSLAAQLAGTPQPPQEAARLTETLARAVQAAHEAGVVHRDLKPANVLLAADGTPKITDFGLAKKLDGTAGQTATGAVLGTPSYMAPEQAGGKSKTIGPAADVYALGAILYECLTGRPPFKAATPFDTVLQVLSEDPVPPRRLQPKVPRDLETICLKCLRKEPAHRYASAADLAADLRRFLAGEPVKARPVGATERLLKWARRRPAAAALLAVSGLAAVALVAGGLEYVAGQKAAAAHERARSEEADRLRQQAEQRELTARRYLYAAHLTLAQQAWDAGRPARTLELLRGQRPDLGQEDLRSFEWYDLWRLCFHGHQRTLREHQGLIRAVAFSPDGRTLASAGGDFQVCLWDTATGQVRARLHGHSDWVDAVAFSPDGRLLASAGGNDRVGELNLWDPATGERLAALPGHATEVLALAFSPDGALLASGSGDPDGHRPGEIKLWRVATRQLVGTLQGHPEQVWSLAFSPDGATLASGSSNRGVRFWDVRARQERPGHGQGGGVQAVAFAPNGKTVASGTWDGLIQLWDPAAGRVRTSLPLALGHVRAVAFSPDGKLLADGSSEGSVRLWDLAAGPQPVAVRGYPGEVFGVAFSPNGRTLAVGGSARTVDLWDVTARPEPVVLRADQHAVTGLAFTPDGRTLVSGSLDQSVRVWDVGTGRQRGTPKGKASAVNAVALSPDGRTAAAAEQSGEVRLWDVETGQARGVLRGHQDAATAVCFTPDGRTVVTGGRDQTVRLWDAASGRERETPLRASTNPVLGVAVSPDGEALVAGTWEWRPSGPVGLVLARDLAAGRWENTYLGGTGWVNAVAFSPDGQTVAAADEGGAIQLWTRGDPRPRALLKGHIGGVRCLAFAPDGRALVSGGEDGAVKVWDAATGQERVTLHRHANGVRSLAFAAGGSVLATGYEDGVIRLWRAATAAEVSAGGE